MPAAITVTNEQVSAAAGQLIREGKRITGWTLRAVIGFGRPSRLAAVWDDLHGEAAGKGLPEPEAPVLPPMIADHLAAATERLSAELHDLVGQSWARAAELATKRVQAEVDAARARVSELEDELAQADEVLEKADETEKMLREEKIEMLAERKATHDEHMESLGTAKDEAIRARADAEAARGMLKHLQDMVTELVRRVPQALDEKTDAPRRGRPPGRRSESQDGEVLAVS